MMHEKSIIWYQNRGFGLTISHHSITPEWGYEGQLCVVLKKWRKCVDINQLVGMVSMVLFI